jgi:hypothetical protein
MDDLDKAQKAKAHRAQVILYSAMALFLIGPLVLYWIFGRK